MNLIHEPEGIYVTQTIYIYKILERFKLEDAKSKNVPLSKGVNFQKFLFAESNDLKRYFPR